MSTTILHIILFFSIILVMITQNFKQQSHKENFANEAKKEHTSIETGKSTPATESLTVAPEIASTYPKLNATPVAAVLQEEKIKLHQLAKDTKLYYVGVYDSSASEYNQNRRNKLYKECVKQNNTGLIADDTECYDYAYSRPNIISDIITIHINIDQPITLVLGSYNSVEWVIKGNTQNIKLLYITGVYGSKLSSNLPTDKMYASFYEDNQCPKCKISQLEIFYEYRNRIQPIIKDYFGHDNYSFQGQFRAKEFYIN